MNSIIIIGGTKKKRELAKSVVDFMIKMLLPRLRTLDITIKFSNLKKDEEAFGFCCAHSSREFFIDLDRKLDHYDLIETLCHEMIHVKQHARKEIKKLKGNSVLWKNIEFDMDQDNYDDFPWEKEAYEYEFIYAREYLRYCGADL